MKKISKIFFVLCAFLFLMSNVNAETVKMAQVDYNNIKVRTGPSTGYDIIKTLAINSRYYLVSEEKFPANAGCDEGWYKIYYSNTKEGYACASYITIVEVEKEEYETSNECEADLKAKGFPRSYVEGLCALKEQFPTWNFEPDFTGLDFATSILKESVVGKSLISSAEPGYLSLDVGSYDWLTDKFTVKEGSTWYAANSDVIAYYMDPRNFFDQRYIFMFEKLSYDETYQTKAAVEAVLRGRDIAQESETILSASQENNINAIYLASKIRQETGGNYTNYSLSGRSVTYDGITYNHVYNPYNIGANTGAADGLRWAVAGTSYLRPWTELKVAIRGGARFVASTYIGQGQNTIYYQKFNTSSYSVYSPYSHEYMTNVRGAASEASIAYNGYNSMELLNDTAFTFVIPVYENLGDIHELPETGNPNNHLSDLKVNGNSFSDFEHDKFEYTIYVSALATTVEIEATTINKNASVTNTGTIQVPNDENVIEVEVTAQNGSKQIYKINVLKAASSNITVSDIVLSLPITTSGDYFLLPIDYKVETLAGEVLKISGGALVKRGEDVKGTLKTGDVITIKTDIDEKNYTVVIKGDPSGDGKISIQDLLKVQKHILNYSTLSDAYFKAADVNQDNTITILDLLRVQKHILGYLEIK